MNKRIVRILSAALTIVLLCTLTAPIPHAAARDRNRDAGRPLRVGYVEGEAYDAFSNALSGIAAGLQELGIISGWSLDPDEPDAEKVWRELCATDGHGKITFVADCFYSMKSMDESEYGAFINDERIDLLIVMGTVAGVYVSEHEERNNYMVFAAANPIGSGIVGEGGARLKQNAYAYIDPSRFRRQVDVAYNIFAFERLGVVYADNPNAYVYSGIGQVEEAARTHGFSIVTRHVEETRDEADADRYYRELREAYRALILEGIDALYITTATTENHMLPWLLEEVVAAGIPTISQVGEGQVKSGVVLGVTLEDAQDQGRFIARQMESLLLGASFDSLAQYYEIVPKVFLNYDAVRATGLRIPFKTLLSADVIFRDTPGAAS